VNIFRLKKIKYFYKIAEVESNEDEEIELETDSWADLSFLYSDINNLKTKWRDFAIDKKLDQSFIGFDKWVDSNINDQLSLTDGIKDLIENIIIPYKPSQSTSNRATSKLPSAPGVLAGIKYPGHLSAIVQDPNSKPPFDYNKWKEEIGQIESGGKYGAVNGSTNALGKFQFVPSLWWNRIVEFARERGINLPGRSSKGVLSVGAAKEQYKGFLTNPQLQEEFMKNYTEKYLLPSLSKLRSEQKQSFPHAALLSDGRIMGLFHFQGPAGARNWLKTGAMIGAEFNAPVPNYLIKIDK